MNNKTKLKSMISQNIGLQSSCKIYISYVHTTNICDSNGNCFSIRDNIQSF